MRNRCSFGTEMEQRSVSGIFPLFIPRLCSVAGVLFPVEAICLYVPEASGARTQDPVVFRSPLKEFARFHNTFVTLRQFYGHTTYAAQFMAV